MSFMSLGLSEVLARAVEGVGYSTPTPVQQRAIPAVLDGRDLMVAAQTGTGKTGGFALPVLERLFPNGHPDREHRHRPKQTRVLVLTPTRELAAQVYDSFQLYARYLPFKGACIFGGVGMNPQIQALRHGLDVLVACPGRLLDLLGQQAVDLSAVEILVLDEADRMLDMGFIHDVKKVLARLPSKRQNLLFSATFSLEIVDLANRLLHNPERIEVTPPNTTVECIEQRVFRIAAGQKRALLAHLVTLGAWEQVLVFTRTKHGANRLAEYLTKQGLPSAAIHGNKSQNARTKALADFKANSVRVLVATDIAARGLDIDQLPHVVNYELPNVEEDYVHRIGRTGRAGRSGEAISLVAPDEEKLLKAIERMTKQRIPDGDWLGFVMGEATESTPQTEERPPRQAHGRGRRDMPAHERKQAPRSEAKRPEATNKPRTPRPERSEQPRSSSPRTNPPAGGRYSERRGAAASNTTPVPPRPDRNPEEFLDDDYDNFGNSVAYVSPYQNRKGNQGQKNRTTTGQPRSAKPTAPSNNSAPYPRAAKPPRRNNTTHRPVNEPPLREPGSVPTRASRERQPVIVHKPSRNDRLPNAEQLEGVERRAQAEKPALLSRSLPKNAEE